MLYSIITRISYEELRLFIWECLHLIGESNFIISDCIRADKSSWIYFILLVEMLRGYRNDSVKFTMSFGQTTKQRYIKALIIDLLNFVKRVQPHRLWKIKNLIYFYVDSRITASTISELYFTKLKVLLLLLLLLFRYFKQHGCVIIE